VHRRLAAIVNADLAGFTRLMDGAETRTFRYLKAAQNEIGRSAVEAGARIQGIAEPAGISVSRAWWSGAGPGSATWWWPTRRYRAGMGRSLVGDTLRIDDLGSTNGTSVYGKPVRPDFLLAAEPGSTIRLGDVKLVVQQDCGQE
jgi:hypothetical protein